AARLLPACRAGGPVAGCLVERGPYVRMKDPAGSPSAVTHPRSRMRVPVATALALLLIVVSSCDRLPGDPFEDPESAALAERMRLAVMGVGPLPALVEMAELAAPRVAAAEPGLVNTFHALRDSAELTVRSGSRVADGRGVTA